MGRGSLFPVLLICYVYVKIVQCDELAKCYTEPAESCPLQNKCKCMKTGEFSLFCCHLQSNEDLVKNLGCSGARLQLMTAYHIYNMTADNFNFAILSTEFVKLISFSITNSYIGRILGRFQPENKITCVNMSNNAFGSEWQDPFALENLKYLAMLDLSNVNITRLPYIKIQVPLFLLDVSNNKKMHCDSILDLMKSCIRLKNKPIFTNPNETFCLSSIGFHWFNSTEKLALSQIEIINKIFEDCPQNCTCKSYGYDMVRDTSTLHTVKVDCSYRQLSNLPENLPENTVLLNVTNNNITSIETLITDQTYKTLRYLYADENKISNILSLEGSTFIDNFLVLSLRLNQLKSIPMYILQNSFVREFDGHIVKLGGNELQCDCSTVQSLKIWLLTNRLHIPDYDEILCDNYQYKLKVIDLDQKVACITEADWTHYMYYVIAAELSVLLLLIGKVSYDYWVFKTAGYLPWPASKMPKLPCDWVFE